MDLFDFDDVAANYDYFVTALGSDPEALVSFHLELAERFGRDGVLDVACGTGATMLALLRAGFEVTGVDLSAAMIGQVHGKLANLPQEVRDRGRLLCANMTEFEAGARYSLAVIPQSGFMHLLTSEDQEQALGNLNRHLLDGGVLSFNTFDPNYRQIAENGPDRPEPRKYLRAEYTNARGRRERLWNALRHDWARQVLEGVWTFEELDDRGEILETRERHKSVPVKSSEITPYSQYLSRRDFMKAAGVVAGSALLAACAPTATESAVPATAMPNLPAKMDELGDSANSFEDITNYNNFYEFTTDKESVARLAQKFNPAPWTVEVSGLVNKPRTFGIEDLLGKFTEEERIYRLRCVEAWSMVIPWTGFTLASLLKEVEPTSDAKYVRFETVYRPEEMPGQDSRFYPWPYQEGLRHLGRDGGGVRRGTGSVSGRHHGRRELGDSKHNKRSRARGCVLETLQYTEDREGPRHHL